MLGAYADFLLDQHRYQDVVFLLQSETSADGLLLRLALAEQALKLPMFQNHSAELAARFAGALRMNGRLRNRLTGGALMTAGLGLALARRP